MASENYVIGIVPCSARVELGSFWNSDGRLAFVDGSMNDTCHQTTWCGVCDVVGINNRTDSIRLDGMVTGIRYRDEVFELLRFPRAIFRSPDVSSQL